MLSCSPISYLYPFFHPSNSTVSYLNYVNFQWLKAMTQGPNLITYNKIIHEEPQTTILALFLAIISWFPGLPFMNLPSGPQMIVFSALMTLPGMSFFLCRQVLTHPSTVSSGPSLHILPRTISPLSGRKREYLLYTFMLIKTSMQLLSYSLVSNYEQLGGKEFPTHPSITYLTVPIHGTS